MAAPAIQTSSESGTSNVFTKPTGLANNDILYILYWSFHGTAGDPAAPAGFSAVAGTSVNYSGSNWLEARIYRKVVTNAGGEAASYTVTRGAGTNHADGGEIYRVSGADTTTPENTTASATSTSATASTGSFTTTNADVLLLAVFADDTNTIGAVTGMTQEFNHDGGDAKGFSQALSATVSGATRTSALGGSKPWAVGLVAVQSPGAATKAPPPRRASRWRGMTQRRVA